MRVLFRDYNFGVHILSFNLLYDSQRILFMILLNQRIHFFCEHIFGVFILGIWFIIKNVSSSISHKNSETLKPWDSGILAFILKHS